MLGHRPRRSVRGDRGGDHRGRRVRLAQAAAAAQLSKAPRNNEAQSFAGTLTSAFVAPWARGHGLARGIVIEIERLARDEFGLIVLNLDLRATQRAAISLYEGL